MDNPADVSTVAGQNQPVPLDKEIKIELPDTGEEGSPAISPTPEPVKPEIPPEAPPPEPPPPVVEPSPPVPPPPPSTDDIIAPPKPKGSFPAKPLVLSLALLLFVSATALSVYFIQKGGLPFNLGKKAADGGGKLICMPVDDNGNYTNDKYRYSRVKVVNESNHDVIVWYQKNLCDYQEGQPRDGYRCDNYSSRSNDTIVAGASKIYSIDVPCRKIGQLDVSQDNEQMLQRGIPLTDGCFNTVDNRVWQGGIAFTIKGNSDPCPGCIAITGHASPSQVKSSSPITFSFTSDYAYINVALNPGSKASQCGDVLIGCGKSPIPGDQKKTYCWTWHCTSASTSGSATATFTGQDNNGQTCPQSVDYSILGVTIVTPSPTPTSTPTRIPTANPTVTATPVPTPACEIAAPGQPRCSEPNGIVVNTTTPTLKWDAPSSWGEGCPTRDEKYQVWLGKEPPPQWWVTEPSLPKEQKSLTVTEPLEEGDYYWQVKAFNGERSTLGGICSFRVDTSYEPWWQTKDGDLNAMGDISSPVSDQAVSPYLSLEGGNEGMPGVVSYGGRLSHSPGYLSETDWKAKTGLSSNQSFDYLANRLKVDKTKSLGGDLESAPEGVYYLAGEGTTLELEGANLGTKKIILFVEKDVRVAGDILISPGGFFALISRGSIAFAPGVKEAHGFYLADQRLTVESQGTDQQFVGEGSFIGLGGVSLNRNLGEGANRTTPGEIFETRYDLYFNAPKDFTWSSFIFQELAP